MKVTAGLVLFVAAILCGPASGQEFKSDPIDVAAAKKEGSVTWYTSTPVAAGQYIANEFQKKTASRSRCCAPAGRT